MKRKREFIKAFTFASLSMTLFSCDKPDDKNVDPINNPPKEVILAKVGTDLDRFTVDAATNTLVIYSSSVAEGIWHTYSRDTTLVGPKVLMNFSKTEFSTVDKNTNAGVFFGRFAAWEETSVNISSPQTGQVVAQEIGGTIKAQNVYYKKVYQPVYFTGFSTQEKAVQTWKDMTQYKGKWTLIKDQKFKIDNKDWQIK